MAARVIVESAGDFGRWQARRNASRVEPTSQEAADGAVVFQRQACAGCHTVRGTTARGTVGPDLTDVGQRETIGAGVLANTPRNLARWIHDAPGVKPGTIMPSFHTLSDRDVRAIVAYLESFE
jgi:cytochrome c oxidase subunit 2